MTAMINIFNSFDHFVARVGAGGAVNFTYTPRAGESSNDAMVHMVSIVGYSSSDRTWIIRNSFGRDSGLDGYIKIKWGDPYVQPEKYVYAPVL